MTPRQHRVFAGWLADALGDGRKVMPRGVDPDGYLALVVDGPGGRVEVQVLWSELDDPDAAVALAGRMGTGATVER